MELNLLRVPNCTYRLHIALRTLIGGISLTKMPLTNSPFETPTESTMDVVYKEIGIDAEKEDNSLTLIREWLKCESYLPDDVDETLLKKFILGSKGNVEKTKEKLEKYLVAKTKLTYLYRDRVIKSEDFSAYPYHRTFYICPKLTPEAVRVAILRTPLKDPTDFVHLKFVKHLCLICDAWLLHDTSSAAYQLVIDAKWFTPQYLAKLNLTAFKHITEVVYNILPIRIKSIILLNDTENACLRTMLNISTALISKKLRNRIFLIKTEDLPNHCHRDCLPIEYGGTQGNFNDVSDRMLEFLKENSEWCKETEKLTLAGPVPEHKKNLYSFEEFNMDGGFRQLTID